MDKLAMLNSLEVVEFSISSGEVEYVLVENKVINRAILVECGATNEDLDKMAETFTNGSPDDGELDISLFAWEHTEANSWAIDGGFAVR